MGSQTQTERSLKVSVQKSPREITPSHQFVAAGIWFSKKFGRAIPLPPTPASASGDSCATYDDSYDWDDGGSDVAVVTGQVHFGDSFAAGMGTGDTSRTHVAWDQTTSASCCMIFLSMDSPTKIWLALEILSLDFTTSFQGGQTRHKTTWRP